MVGRQKSLRLSGRFEATHALPGRRLVAKEERDFLSFGGRSVRSFNPVVQALVRAMMGIGRFI